MLSRFIFLGAIALSIVAVRGEDVPMKMEWQQIAELPNKTGVAGPFAGTHHDVLIVAGGANFPEPVWENAKVWYDDIFVLKKTADELEWINAGKLPYRNGYGATVSTADGVICMGGNDGTSTFRDVIQLRWNAQRRKVQIVDLPSLPQPCCNGQAVIVGDTVYLAGGQSDSGLNSAMNNLWALDLSKRSTPDSFKWQQQPSLPGPGRAFNLTVAQHNGQEECVYVISGRRQDGDDVQFLTDVWEYSPSASKWTQKSAAPRCVMAGTAVPLGQQQVLVLGGADGSLFHKSDELKDQHPGFIRQALVFETGTGVWKDAGTIPQNHVTTVPVQWNDRIIIPSGEIRPRVRSPAIWSVEL